MQNCNEQIYELIDKVDRTIEYLEEERNYPRPPIKENFVKVVEMCLPLVSDRICYQQLTEEHPVLELFASCLDEYATYYSEDVVLMMAMGAEVELQGIYYSCVELEGNTAPGFEECSENLLNTISVIKSCEEVYEQGGSACDFESSAELVQNTLRCIEDAEIAMTSAVLVFQS